MHLELFLARSETKRMVRGFPLPTGCINGKGFDQVENHAASEYKHCRLHGLEKIDETSELASNARKLREQVQLQMKKVGAEEVLLRSIFHVGLHRVVQSRLAHNLH